MVLPTLLDCVDSYLYHQVQEEQEQLESADGRSDRLPVLHYVQLFGVCTGGVVHHFDCVNNPQKGFEGVSDGDFFSGPTVLVNV